MKPHDYTRQAPLTHDFIPDTDKNWIHRDITEKIIGAAIEVHKVLGEGFLEYVYQEALCYELKLIGISFEIQKELNIWYKNFLIPRKYAPDLIVEDCVIIELKATTGLTNNDEAQLLNYLKATKKRIGLLLNFGKGSLEVKRRIV